MMKPTLNDIKSLIEQAEKLKQKVEQLKKKSFLTPGQSEAIKDRKRGIEIALYLLRLSYTNEEECENNFGIVDSYFTLTGSLDSGRFVQKVGGPEELRRVPSWRECRFCDISKADCPERIDTEPTATAEDHDLF